MTIDQILILLGFALFVFMAYESGINRGFACGKAVISKERLLGIADAILREEEKARRGRGLMAH